MSEAKDALELLEKQNALITEQRKMMDEKVGQAEYKEQELKIDKAINDLADAQLKLEKSIKEKAQVKSFDGDEQKRKECSEFLFKLRDIAKGNISHFKTDELKSVQEYKDYNSNQDPQGGAVVMPFLDSEIDKLMREFTNTRSLVSTVSIGTDKWTQLKMNQGNGALWRHQMTDFASQTKNNTLNELAISVEDLFAIAIFSDNLIQDQAFDLVGQILSNAAEDFAITEASGLWTGSGVGEMKGILTAADATDSFDSVERIETNDSGDIIFNDIYDLIGSIKESYENNAQFKANRLVITHLRKLRSDSGAGAGTGDYLWQPSNIVGVPATLAGFPISQATELSGTIAAAAESIVFGDFRKAYKIVDRTGMEVVRDNLTQYPNIAYKMKKRVGGGVVKGEALKILKVKA